jgi:hypothetical protein
MPVSCSPVISDQVRSEFQGLTSFEKTQSLDAVFDRRVIGFVQTHGLTAETLSTLIDEYGLLPSVRERLLQVMAELRSSPHG